MTGLTGQRSASNGATPGVLALQARIALARLGWLKVCAALLIAAGLLAWLWVLPYWHERLAARQAAISAARQPAPQPAAAPAPNANANANKGAAAQNLTRFRSSLGNARAVETHLKTIFALAGKAGLSVEQADYKLAADSHGQFQTYQIILPLKGSYAGVRQFGEQVLRELPFAALDEIAFKRDDARDAQPQARLRFTLYLAASPPAPAAKIQVREERR